jgi:hypothetical protein
MVGISSFWQIRVIDRPQMPACPGLAALGAATEKAIERPFAIKAKRLKRTIRPAVSHDEFRPIAAGLAYSIPRCFHGCVLSIARVPRSSSRAAAVVQSELSSCGAMSRLRLVGVVFRASAALPSVALTIAVAPKRFATRLSSRSIMMPFTRKPGANRIK